MQTFQIQMVVIHNDSQNVYWILEQLLICLKMSRSRQARTTVGSVMVNEKVIKWSVALHIIAINDFNVFSADFIINKYNFASLCVWPLIQLKS